MFLTYMCLSMSVFMSRGILRPSACKLHLLGVLLISTFICNISIHGYETNKNRNCIQLSVSYMNVYLLHVIMLMII